MDGVRGLLVRRLDETEDLPLTLVEPVLQVLDPVLVLDGEIFLRRRPRPRP